MVGQNQVLHTVVLSHLLSEACIELW